MTQTLIAALAGGALIGLAAVLLMLTIGRIAGIAGVVAGLLRWPTAAGFGGDAGWRAAFLLGLAAGPFAAAGAGADLPAIHVDAAWPLVGIAGLLVGLGARLGNGCTSGHGVCGLARLSRRSLAATLTFMAVAAVVVFVTRHVVGG